MTQTKIEIPFAPVQTKLHPQQVSREPLIRHHLKLFIQPQVENARVISVIAPAGYGKSTLLIQWQKELNQKKISNTWLSLDADDNDPAHFLEYWIAAFNRLNPPLGLKTKTLFLSGHSASWTPILDSLLQDLYSFKKPAFFIIDDLHFITSPEVLSMIDQFIERAPENFHFIIGSRVRPALKLGQWKVRQQLLEIQAEKMSFTREEAQTFLNEFHQLSLSKSTIEDIYHKTEGWPVAIQLISLLLQENPSNTDFLKDFSGEDQDLGNYLGDVILNRQSPELMEFMLRVSILDRMCAPLCEVLTGQEKSQKLLEKIEASNLFFFPLDRKKEWYRFHHLFSDFLRHRYKTEFPESIAASYTQASLWFAQQNLTVEAVDYAFRGKNYDLAAQLMAGYVLGIVQHQGDNSTLLKWMQQLPESYLNRWPVIRLGYAMSLAFTTKYTQALAELDHVRQYLQQSEAAPQEMSLLESFSDLVRSLVFMFTDQIQKLYDIISTWSTRWPNPDPFQAGGVQLLYATRAMLTYKFEEGFDYLDQATAQFQSCNSLYGMAWVYGNKILLLMLQGEFFKARQVCEESLQFFKEIFGENNVPSQMIKLLLRPQVDYQQGELEKVELLQDEMLRFIYVQNTTEGTLGVYLILSKILFLRKQDSAAEQLLQEGIQLGKRIGFRRLELTLQAQWIKHLLESQEVEKAKDLAQKAGFFDMPLRDVPQGIEHIFLELQQMVQIRLAMAESNFESVLHLLEPLIQQARLSQRNLQLTHLYMLKSQACFFQNQHQAAVEALELALEAGVIGYCVMGIIEESKAFKEFVRQRVEQLNQNSQELQTKSYLEKILNQLKMISHRSKKSLQPKNPLDELLSRREIELAQYLDSPLSLGQIAQKNFISERTVKWHLSNIYKKLHVKNRTGAVKRLRELSA